MGSWSNIDEVVEFRTLLMDVDTNRGGTLYPVTAMWGETNPFIVSGIENWTHFVHPRPMQFE